MNAMPIFEYRCASCRKRFESLQSRADEASPPCPHCGAKGPERLLSTFAVVGGQPEPARGPCGSADCACRND
jgi:putative FmdB family regulatory protein